MRARLNLGPPSLSSLFLPSLQSTIAALAARVRTLEAQLDTERLARAAAEAAAAARARAVPEDEAEWEALEGAALTFKAARDKAVAALAAAHDDLDRVGGEAAALASALAESRATARALEGAAAEAAGRADLLADLLEESASLGAAAGDGGGPDAGAPSLEAALAAERARCARLEAAVTALCLEAGRVGGLASGVAGAILPALAAVEERLGGVAFPAAVPVSR